MGINRDDWLKALADVGISSEDDPEAITAAEFAALLNVSRSSAHSRLQMLVQNGRATQTMKWTSASDGRRHHCTAYRLKEPDKKGKR